MTQGSLCTLLLQASSSSLYLWPPVPMNCSQGYYFVPQIAARA